MFHLTDLAGLSPISLIETVSIEVDDFSDSFLTCGTCMQVYDESSRKPKLLPCSHTVCYCCATTAINSAATREGALACCPICSQEFPMPAGGAASLPASFVVNQLFDLIAVGRRRDVIPKCAEHVTAELLFCETCDAVFCALCDADGCGIHGSAGATASAAHTVVPFAVAIRRVSEILQYKADQCLRNLEAAARAVELEMHRVDDVAEQTVQETGRIFAELLHVVDHRKLEVVSSIRNTAEEKKQALIKQLDIVNLERGSVDFECHGLPPDIRSITARIENLNKRIDASLSLAEPRENAFIVFNNSGLLELCSAIQNFGLVRVSDTFPALCTVSPPEPAAAVHLVSRTLVIAHDQNGKQRTVGGDPVSVELRSQSGARVPVFVCDNGNGTYDVIFTPATPGRHVLTVSVFERAVSRGVPLSFDVIAFHEPLATFSSELRQPVVVSVDGNEQLYALDTGNSRITLFDARASTCNALGHICSVALEQRGATGMWLCQSTPSDESTFVVANWRLRQVYKISSSGQVLQTFCSDLFIEPTSATVSNNGTVFIADNAAGTIFAFSPAGLLIGTIGVKGEKPGELGLVTCLYASPVADEILVCDHRIQAFSSIGKFLYALPMGDAVGRGQYGGVAIDTEGRYLVSRSEKGRAIIQVFNGMKEFQFSIDGGPAAKMRRPSGLALDGSGHVFVADLGNGCVRKFRYL